MLDDYIIRNRLRRKATMGMAAGWGCLHGQTLEVRILGWAGREVVLENEDLESVVPTANRGWPSDFVVDVEAGLIINQSETESVSAVYIAN